MELCPVIHTVWLLKGETLIKTVSKLLSLICYLNLLILEGDIQWVDSEMTSLLGSHSQAGHTTDTAVKTEVY